MKLREEVETVVGSADTLIRVFAELGFEPRFRYQKYRTELALADVVVAIDETPIGVFVELEGAEASITDAARRMGRTADDYVRASYRRLFLESRASDGVAAADAGDMIFDRS
jgi:adenylate cyclase class 2